MSRRRWSVEAASLQDLLEELSWLAFVLLALAIFFLFSTIGFLVDIMGGGRQPAAELVATVIFSGCISLVYAYGGLRRSSVAIVIGITIHITFANVMSRIFDGAPRMPAAHAGARLTFDAAAILVAIVASYTCFLWFINTTAARYMRIRAEIELAREIHRVLVPRIATRLGAYECFGVSIPSGEVGGDLVDVVAERDGWIGYVADVSGHGVSSGVLMGMFKSALRVRLLSAASLAAILADLNRVLVPLKSASMYVTFAAVRHDGQNDLEFAVAGHLPILKIRAVAGSVEEVTTDQLAIGFFDDTRFTSSRLACAPGDLLALVTDGLTEVFNRHDEQFGLDRLKAVLAGNATRPLPEIAAALTSAVAAFGRQLDDQTLLLIRRMAAP
jgi:phosphoserine phosphatase RsbU/P